MAKNSILIRSKLKKAQKFSNENKLHEAKNIYEGIYVNNKGNTSIALELAIIYRRLSEFEKASNVCETILQISPNYAMAHHVYGSAKQCLGDSKNAILEYKKAIHFDPKLTESYYFLGNLYREIGLLEESANYLNKAINLKPDFYEALNNYAAAQLELHHPIEARKALNAAMKIDATTKQILCNISGLHLLENNTDEALSYALKVYAIDSVFFDCLKLLGDIYYKKAKYDDSLEFYHKANNIRNDLSVIGSIGEILERRGQFDEAFNIIKPWIDYEGSNPKILLTYSALSRKFNTQKSAISAIQKLLSLSSSTLDAQSEINLHSELGKQYDALEEFDNAFFHYKKANLLDRKYNEEMPDLLEKKVLDNINAGDISKWRELYTEKFWNNLPKSESTSDRPIFVVGMFRSGTTLVEQILSSHPDVFGAGELQDINKLSADLCEQKLHDKSVLGLINVTQEKLNAAAEKYLETLQNKSIDHKRVVDKMPSNFFHIGLINLLFPNAYIINMIRDPRDVCLSMYFQRFGSQMTFSTSLEELADYYLSYKHIMQYWKNALDVSILDVVYESLVSEPENEIRKIITFCDLEWNDSCLSFHNNKRDVNTPSYDQVRKPMYNKSIGRWKNYEKHIGPLVDGLYGNFNVV